MILPNILMVDDDMEDQQIIRDAFVEIDSITHITFAQNGQEAMDLLSESSAPLPCLIILDLNMPRMNGRQTLDLLKRNERFKKIPVIIYSTSVNEYERKACLELGAADYITKPLSYKSAIETAQRFDGFCERGK